MSLRKQEALFGLLFILPALLGFVVFVAGPILASLYFSLTEFKIISAPRWIGQFLTFLKNPPSPTE